MVRATTSKGYNGAKSYEEVEAETQVGIAYGACIDEVKDLVNTLSKTKNS